MAAAAGDGRPAVRRLAAALSLLLLGLSAAGAWALLGPRRAGQGRPDEAFLRGMTLGLFTAGEPGSIGRSLDELEALGVGAISLVIPKATPDVRSSRFFDADGITPTDAALTEAIREARSRRMSVMLFPIVHVIELETGEWRGTLEPADWDAWFRAYSDVILHYARMAEAEGADLLSIGSELCSAESQAAHWRELIAKVRRIYGGNLLYSANWDHYRGVPFVQDLDYLGINAYYQLTDDLHPEVEQLRAAWGPIKVDLLAWAHRHGLPLVFTEVGYPSREGAGIDPWDYTASRPASPEVQRRCYRAFIEAWSEVPQLHGVFFYVWWGEGGRHDRDYTPRGKPAAGEIARWFHRSHGGRAVKGPGGDGGNRR